MGRAGKDRVPVAAASGHAAQEAVDGNDVPEGTPSVTQIGPYRVLGTLGEGATSVVYVARRDGPVDRRVALKVLRPELKATRASDLLFAEYRILANFSHLGTPRAFDSGETDDGLPYFAMELAEGPTLRDFCLQGDVSFQDRLQLVISLCEVLQHVHQRGFVHSDLKPANVVVMHTDGGPRPVLLDFGAAARLLRDTTTSTLASSEDTDRKGIGTPAYMSPEQKHGGLPVDTRWDVYALGIILFELLTGRLPDPSSRQQRPSDCIGHGTKADADIAQSMRLPASRLRRWLRSDLDWIVMKAIAHHPDERYGDVSLLRRDLELVLRGDPVSMREKHFGYRVRKLLYRHRKPVWIGAAAASTMGMAAAVGGVVAASVTSVTLVGLLAALVGTNLILRRVEATRKREQRLTEDLDRQRHLAGLRERAAIQARDEMEESRAEAERERQKAELQYREFMQMSDVRRSTELSAEETKLRAVDPSLLPSLRRWVEEARELSERLPTHRGALQRLEESALPYTAEERERDRSVDPIRKRRLVLAGELATYTRLIGELESRLEERFEPQPPPESETGPHERTREETQTELDALRRHVVELTEDLDACVVDDMKRHSWRFEHVDDQWRHDIQSELVSGLVRLQSDAHTAGSIAAVEARIQLIEEVEEQTLHSEASGQLWDTVAASIRESNAYAGFEVAPQFGLLPLSVDPQTGLWEFWLPQTGARPERNADPESPSRWRIDEETGVVMVLLPGGTRLLGGQAVSAEEPLFVPQATERDGPVYEVDLAPFFISRYLVTQGQWKRLTGTNPSSSRPPANAWGNQHDLTYPVEQVSWHQSVEVLSQVGLELPTEAQWEYAARGGTDTPWWTGAERNSLQGAANLADRFHKLNSLRSWSGDEELFDGYVLTSPVDRFRPNPFGLHDVHGNVGEWCRDAVRHWTEETERLPGTGEVPGGSTESRPYRGGSFMDGPTASACACRATTAPDAMPSTIGVRPSRPVRPK